MKITPRQLAKAMPIIKAESRVVAKRKANNAPKKRGTGFNSRVTDNDPMAKDGESNWP
ncbi:MAG: hypothetical protein KGL39_49520 [Patescibacteria group bacterium]|nr:hypothetical protein [Patescibacteria group bacterium]